MASTARTVVRRRLGALIAGAVMLTALSVATAGASATAPTGVQAARLARPVAGDPGSGPGAGAAPAPAAAAARAPSSPRSSATVDTTRASRRPTRRCSCSLAASMTAG
jgi:hypothetical protein